MLKYNKLKMAMYQKYGPGWDSPLFHSGTTTVEPAQAQAPLIIDDATEEKAFVFTTLNIEEQRKRVLEAFRQLQPATDNDVARVLNLVPSTVAARRNNNIELGLIIPVLDEHGKKIKRKDPLTNEPNTLWKVK